MKFYTLYVQYALYHKTGSLQVKEPVTIHLHWENSNEILLYKRQVNVIFSTKPNAKRTTSPNCDLNFLASGPWFIHEFKAEDFFLALYQYHIP